MKIPVGYTYKLSGDFEIDVDEYTSFCKDNTLEPYEDKEINMESLKEFILEKYDLVGGVNDGNLEGFDILSLNEERAIYKTDK